MMYRPVIGPDINFVELEFNSNVTDVVWHGRFGVSTYPDESGSIVRITQAQYDALSDADKASGKLYSISDAS